MTFDGIAKACAKAAGAPEPELIHYNPKDYDFGKNKAFPMRDQHFFASVDKARGLTPPHALRPHPVMRAMHVWVVACVGTAVTSAWSRQGG